MVSKVECVDNMEFMARTHISDIQIGKAGEYLVCADLILNGHVAFLSEQGLPFDIVLEHNKRLLKVQVKTTRGQKFSPQRKSVIPVYIFHVGNNGKFNRRKKYHSHEVDIFALVDLDTKLIAYLPFFNCQTTMVFRVPSERGNYHDEKGKRLKSEVLGLKRNGYSIDEIVELTGLKKSNVYRYSANVSIQQKGTNSGVYFDAFPLQTCLEKLFQRRM